MVGQFNRKEVCIIYFLFCQLHNVLNVPLSDLDGNSQTLIGTSSSSSVAQAQIIGNKNNNSESLTRTGVVPKTRETSLTSKENLVSYGNSVSQIFSEIHSALVRDCSDAQKARGCPACADPDCGNPVYKWIWDFRAIKKTFVGLAVGTVVFFVLFFAYKLVSYTDEIDYGTSVYYGSGSKKPFLRRTLPSHSRGNRSGWNSFLETLSRNVFDALETSF